MKETAVFNYSEAFDRNIGWLDASEQEKLSRSHVGIFGLGGTGGFQAQVLARLGVGRLTLVDPDVFELTNTNRQIGASTETIGRKKADVIAEMVKAINPAADIRKYDYVPGAEELAKIVGGLNLAVDGIDFFSVDAKMSLFKQCRSSGIPALTSAPIGFGASLIVFHPTGMSAPDYFDIADSAPKNAKAFSLAFGLSPSPLCLSYLKPNALSVGGSRASSVCPGLMLTGAITGSEAVKILTGKGKTFYAPYVYQVDLMTQKAVKKYYPMGMKSPWMKFKKYVIKKFVLKGSE